MSRSRDRIIADRLSAWFARSARDLPWRVNRTGYTALVSETMLQQTQVSRVIEHYESFMRVFPNVRALAAADEQHVLAAWQGLGYYRRARNLHAAARMIVQQFGGCVPSNVNDLMTLPGVGRYTAGAIASIAFNRPAAIVDGNVQRVLARLDAIAELPPTSAWQRAEQLVHAAQQPGPFNEAVMELGATVCTPANPRCESCPLQPYCLAHQQNLQQLIPQPKSAAAPVVVHHHAVILMRSGLIRLEQRPSRGLWSNMWQVPTIEAPAPLKPAALARQLRLGPTQTRKLTSFQHMTSHRRITFHVYAGRSRGRRGTWRSPNDVNDLPLSNAQKRIVAMAGELLRTPVTA